MNSLTEEQAAVYGQFAPDRFGLWIGEFNGIKYKIYDDGGSPSRAHFLAVYQFIIGHDKIKEIVDQGIRAALGFSKVIAITACQPQLDESGECFVFFVIPGQTGVVINKAVFVRGSLSRIEFEFI